MKEYKPIPVSAAKRIAEEFDKNQVIIVAWDREFGREHVTTYGKTKKECDEAAIGGNFVKKALGWVSENTIDHNEWVPKGKWKKVINYWPEPETGDVYEVKLKDGTTVVGLFQDWGFEKIDDEDSVWGYEYGNQDEILEYRKVKHVND